MANGIFNPETESFKKFTEGVGSSFNTWRDEAGTAMEKGLEGAIGAVQGAAGDVYEHEVQPAVESAGKLVESVGKGVTESPVGQAVGDIAGKVSDLLPDIAETAGLGISSKLLNSAMGVAQGTAGQAVSKVAVPVVEAANIVGSGVGSMLPHPESKKGGR